jgi:hypothetical protein
MAWFCSSPEHDDRVTSTTSNCNTASPVRASLRHRSRMHRPRERLPVPPEKLALPNASWTNLDVHGLRVKQARGQLKVRARQIPGVWSANLTLGLLQGCP